MVCGWPISGLVGNLGALALVVREQPTIRKALDVLVGYMFLHSESLLLNMREQDGQLILNLAIDVDRPVPIRQGVELGVGFLHRSFQQLFREHWKPQTVCFTHAAPPRKNVYLKFFGTNVAFNQDFNGIVCASRDIDAAVPAADAKMVRHVQQYLDTLASRRNATMSATVPNASIRCCHRACVRPIPWRRGSASTGARYIDTLRARGRRSLR